MFTAVLSGAVIVLGMAGSWLTSRGKLKAAYWLGVFTGSGYFLLNVFIAVNGQPGVILLAVPSA